MSFRDILKSSVEAVDGGLASVVMGFDGIAVEEYVREAGKIDVQTLGVEYSSALTEVRRTAESLSAGNVQEVAVVTDGALVLLRPVNADYFLALVLAQDGNFGQGRYVLKRAGVAALGAAGAAALSPTAARAAGSGDTLASWFSPYRVVDTRGGPKLAPGADMVVGPFPTPGQPFNSDSYLGLAANLTATDWTGRGGWLSVRPNGARFAGAPAVPLVYFGGKVVEAWANFFVERFGDPLVVPPPVDIRSDGRIVVHNGGPSPVHFLLDVYFYLGPDQ